MMSQAQTSKVQYVVTTPVKNLGIAILLTILFGPFGMLYSTIKGALVVLFGFPIAFGAVAVAMIVANSGVGILLLIPAGIIAWWVIAIAWTVVSVNSYNKRLMQSVGA